MTTPRLLIFMAIIVGALAVGGVGLVSLLLLVVPDADPAPGSGSC